ncbi:sugar kinase [Halopelagius longus]|uniref:5-dehydro-2-deoxygluconokinase n=1 Tax=Halopelagius longus TaxID=1236180 RepID=A0A1H1GVP6_9EURY|nr:sugar kinase [Halopelagius longus]RDI69533.1 sugar kinase [Halopelagius longus]SDR17247.1 5-dehydro-2-deoxygluconokinase [Halopelagius longus]
MVDVVTFGEAMVFMNPQKVGPLTYITDFKKRMGGAEANVAIGLARLGHEVGWFGKLGKDPHGKYIENFIRGEGVDTQHILCDSELPTGLYFKERSAVGESRFHHYRHGSAASDFHPEDLPVEYISDAKYLHITGIFPALSDNCLATTRRAIEIAKENGVRISFDPNVRGQLWESEGEIRSVLNNLLSQADIALPGVGEGKRLFGTDDPWKIASECLDRGPDTAVVKLGPEGALVSNGKSTECVEAPNLEHEVDPVGAGDGFAAGFLAGRLEGLNLSRSVRLGNGVGALATTVTSDVEGLPSRTELNTFLRNGELTTKRA